jgi:glycosyltransferase involved in cell wall biosynthesis
VVRGIDEGIRLLESAPGVDLPGLLCGAGALLSIDPARAGRPVILNVGRLHPAKGQYNLVRAWAEAGLWQTHNLFLIGGDFQNPSPTEKKIIGQILNYLDHHPELKGLIRFQPSTANAQIRLLQEALGRRELSPYPDVSFCSSLKEEFGISIIEAMGAGMVVLAPLLGGSWEYLRHGINGFRVDTSSPEALGREFRACVYESGLTPERFRAMGNNARRTIRERYSLEKVADDFIQVYLKVTGDIPQRSG